MHRLPAYDHKTLRHWSDGMDAHSASVRFAYAAWRYAQGGKDEAVPLRECIRWLQLLEAENVQRLR